LTVPAKPLPFERLDRDGVADDELGAAAELLEMPVRPDARLREVAGLRLVQVLRLRLGVGQLDGVVAVGLVGLDAHHRAWTSLDHRDGHDGAVLGEQLGHPHLLADDCLHRDL
jgi:hypothetical protein